MNQYFLDVCPPLEDFPKTDNHYETDRLCARLWKQQLDRCLPCPEGSRYKIFVNPHDLCDYRSVEYVYDENDEAHIRHIWFLENRLPEKWDTLSKGKLIRFDLAHDLAVGPYMVY